RIAVASRRPQQKMSDRHLVLLLRGSEVRSHQAADRTAVRVMRDGRAQSQAFARFVKVVFPSEPRDHVALAEQEAVADFVRAGPSIHDPQNTPAAAIRHLEKNGAIPLIYVLRLQSAEVGG